MSSQRTKAKTKNRHPALHRTIIQFKLLEIFGRSLLVHFGVYFLLRYFIVLKLYAIIPFNKTPSLLRQHFIIWESMNFKMLSAFFAKPDRPFRNFKEF